MLEVGHRGIVFLDEIGDMDPAIQPKLLKALEEKTFRRLGDVRDRHVDIRLIASTNLDLEEMVRTKKFRDDLYYRISTLTLRIPPLRERPEDILVLARNILAERLRADGAARRPPDPRCRVASSRAIRGRGTSASSPTSSSDR